MKTPTYLLFAFFFCLLLVPSFCSSIHSDSDSDINVDIDVEVDVDSEHETAVEHETDVSIESLHEHEAEIDSSVELPPKTNIKSQPKSVSSPNKSNKSKRPFSSIRNGKRRRRRHVPYAQTINATSSRIRLDKYQYIEVGFKKWLGKHSRSKRYHTRKDPHYAFRLALFAHNHKRILSHNERYKQGRERYTVKTTEFGDKTPSEVAKGYKIPPNRLKTKTIKMIKNRCHPNSIKNKRDNRKNKHTPMFRSLQYEHASMSTELNIANDDGLLFSPCITAGGKCGTAANCKNGNVTTTLACPNSPVDVCCVTEAAVQPLEDPDALPVDACSSIAGVCTSSGSCNTTIEAGLCSGSQVCCLASSPSTDANKPLVQSSSCSAIGGKCVNIYANTCGTVQYGLCGGAASVACCINKAVGPVQPDVIVPPSSTVEKIDWTLYDKFNWVTKGFNTEVESQSTCGCCWAFTATGAIAGARFVKEHKSEQLSVQQLLDCSGAGTCVGGFTDDAFTWVANSGNGLTLSSTYPYAKEAGQCRADPSQNALTAFPVTGFRQIEGNSCEETMNTLEVQGPLAVAIDASDPSFNLYSDGLYSPPNFANNPDHALLLVGHGVYKDGTKYGILKNEWGPQWGRDGFIRIPVDTLMLCDYVSYPVL